KFVACDMPEATPFMLQSTLPSLNRKRVQFPLAQPRRIAGSGASSAVSRITVVPRRFMSLRGLKRERVEIKAASIHAHRATNQKCQHEHIAVPYQAAGH